jgi:alpha-L-rhamnosidase
LLALGFDLLPEEQAEKAVAHLLDKIEAADGHLRTGFLGTPLLAPVLDRFGHSELAYSLLFKETYPSWFYSINQGATTMWERWNSYTLEEGFNPQGMNSFNHYAYGAIGQWMYERIAGIAPRAAGYREINFAPVIHPPLTTAAATYDSPYGNISSSWEVTDGALEWEITVPPNTKGFVSLPDGYGSLKSVRRKNGESVQVSAPEEKGAFHLPAGEYLIVAE